MSRTDNPVVEVFTKLENSLFENVSFKNNGLTLKSVQKIKNDITSGNPVLLVYSSQLALKALIKFIGEVDGVYVIHNNLKRGENGVGKRLAARREKVVFHICPYKSLASLSISDDVRYYLDNCEKIVYVSLERTKASNARTDNLTSRFWTRIATTTNKDISTAQVIENTLKNMVETDRLRLAVVADSLETRLATRIDSLRNDRPNVMVLDNPALDYLRETERGGLFSEITMVPCSPLRTCYIYPNGGVIDKTAYEAKDISQRELESTPSRCFAFYAILHNAMPQTAEWAPELTTLYTNVNNNALPIYRDVSVTQQFFEWDLVTVVIPATYLRLQLMRIAKTKVGKHVMEKLKCDSKAEEFCHEFMYNLISGYSHNYEFVPESVGAMLEKSISLPYALTLTKSESSLNLSLGVCKDVPNQLRVVAKNQSYGVTKRALHFDLLDAARNFLPDSED